MENEKMLGLFRKLGFATKRLSDGIMRSSLKLRQL